VIYALRPDPRLRVRSVQPHRLIADGWLDVTTVGSLIPPLSDALAAGTDVELDLRNVYFIDVAGVRLFVEAAQRLSERGRRLTLASTPEWLPRILDILRYETAGLVLQ